MDANELLDETCLKSTLKLVGNGSLEARLMGFDSSLIQKNYAHSKINYDRLEIVMG